jgi:hypothetical protein
MEFVSRWSLLDMIRILNVSLVGTHGGPMVRVMCLEDLFLYLTVGSLVQHIYIFVNRTGRARGLIVFRVL